MRPSTRGSPYLLAAKILTRTPGVARVRSEVKGSGETRAIGPGIWPVARWWHSRSWECRIHPFP
jgi:hypothetical protein